MLNKKLLQTKVNVGINHYIFWTGSYSPDINLDVAETCISCKVCRSVLDRFCQFGHLRKWTSIEKLPPSNLPMGILLDIALANDWHERVQLTMGNVNQVILGSIIKQDEQAMHSKKVNKIYPWPLFLFLPLGSTLSYLYDFAWWWTMRWQCKPNKYLLISMCDTNRILIILN